MALGPYLRQERELRRVPLEEVSRVTRIPRSTLDLLEADELVRLPGRAYIVGYLRAYASAVGLDPEELLLRYQEQTGETPAMAPSERPPAPAWKGHAPVVAALVVAGGVLYLALRFLGS
ncbi:MAG: helix-turn-helix domain-containing protein [Deltaproteobacteria bacterium]|nr:helix-turn-helix domain-containing protein [Deltaproteobacteria bacterium]